MAKIKKEKKSGFWSDFRKFIMRGNVLDLAVAVVVGGAFNKIVSGLVTYIINPFIGIFMKEGSLDTVKTVITPAVIAEDGVTVVTPEVAILWGTWLQTILDFLIIALVIFIIVLQQLDGNVIGPKILGSSIGINGFWVMFSIILGGGLFGFWGMLLGVPVFVVIYTALGKLVTKKLVKRDLPTDTDEYMNIDHIDPVTREIIAKEKTEEDK